MFHVFLRLYFIQWSKFLHCEAFLRKSIWLDLHVMLDLEVVVAAATAEAAVAVFNSQALRGVPFGATNPV
jgi:hypothetical protein